MAQFFLIIFTAIILTTQCGSVYAGWFDRKKEPVAQVSAVANTPPASTAQVSVPVKKEAVAPAKTEVKAAFLDLSNKGAKWDYESKAEAAKNEPASVRLDSQETQKVKEDMLQLRQDIQSAQAAKKTAVDVGAPSIPVIPKVPEIIRPVKPALPAMPARPSKAETFKNVTVSKTNGYKQ